MDKQYFNHYSSVYHSSKFRVQYLALNRHGQPRKVHVPASRTLGKLSTYTKTMPQPVSNETFEIILSKRFGSNHVKHPLKQLCDGRKTLIELTDKILKARPKCNLTNNKLGKNKKKKKRKCQDDEPESDLCVKNVTANLSIKKKLSGPLKNQKMNVPKKPGAGKEKNNNNKKGGNKNLNKKNKNTTTRMTTTERPNDEETSEVEDASMASSTEFFDDDDLGDVGSFNQFNQLIGDEDEDDEFDV